MYYGTETNINGGNPRIVNYVVYQIKIKHGYHTSSYSDFSQSLPTKSSTKMFFIIITRLESWSYTGMESGLDFSGGD